LARLLARYADGLFWMGRYIERAENLARLIDVNQSYARDGGGSPEGWLSLVQINSDEERFFARHGQPSFAAVTEFYLQDVDNPTSVRFAIKAARNNARMLRALISAEMWGQLNIVHNWLKELPPTRLTLPELPRLCAAIKEACQAHAGITEGTFFRDEGWYFYQIGRHLERADQTTRLIDVGFRRAEVPAADGSGPPVGRWILLLRSAAGYHAFRRVHPRGLQAADIAAFLLLHPAFPRSVALCVGEIEALLNGLRRGYGLRGGAGALELLDHLRAELPARPPALLLQAGLHEFLDWIQRQLSDVTNRLTAEFFPG
jgi:uncharacterized alpha-E superfamily protein